MKEKVKIIIVIVIFVGILVIANAMLKTAENSEEITNTAEVENTQVERNIKTTTIASYSDSTSGNENQNSVDTNQGTVTNEIADNTSETVVTEVTEATFEKEVLKSDKKVLIDFYADWCSPCKTLSPIVEEVAKENPNIKVVKIDVDSNESLAYKYQAYSIPTLVVIENGEEVNRSVGAIPKADVLGLIK